MAPRVHWRHLGLAALCATAQAWAVTVSPGWQEVDSVGSLPVTIEVTGTHTENAGGELTFFVTEGGKQIPSRVYGKRSIRVTQIGQSHTVRITIQGSRRAKRTVLVCASVKLDTGSRGSSCSTTYIK